MHGLDLSDATAVILWAMAMETSEVHARNVNGL